MRSKQKGVPPVKNAKNFIGARLHPEKDKDIIEDINKFKDKTKRLKDIYRKGLTMENTLPNTSNTSNPAQLPIDLPPKKLNWKVPEKIVPNKKTEDVKVKVLSNIKQGF